MPRATQFKNFMVKPRTLTATTTLAEVDSGKTIFLNSTTEFDVTLPLPKAGLNFKFIVKAAPSGDDYNIGTSSAANIMMGQIYTTDVNSGTDPGFISTVATATDKVTFVDGVAVVGDSVEMISDGTYWYFRGFCSVYNGITSTVSSSASPSLSPSKSPSLSPSLSPSKSPSLSPSASPSKSPSLSPSLSPSVSPSA